MDEDERRPLAAHEVAEPRPGRRQAPFFESDGVSRLDSVVIEGIFFP